MFISVIHFLLPAGLNCHTRLFYNLFFFLSPHSGFRLIIDKGWCSAYWNLAFLFVFTDEARGKNCGVLVHCLAGISRSVTVTVAYLMQKLNLSMNDAYDIVKMKKSNISPNFNFMGQLLDFERTLGLSSPCDNRVPAQQLYFTTPSNQNVYQVDSLQSTWKAPHILLGCVCSFHSFLAASAGLLSLCVAPGVKMSPAVCIRQGYQVWDWLLQRERFVHSLWKDRTRCLDTGSRFALHPCVQPTHAGTGIRGLPGI